LQRFLFQDAQIWNHWYSLLSPFFFPPSIFPPFLALNWRKLTLSQYNMPSLALSGVAEMPQLSLRILEITDCLISDEQLTFLSCAVPSLTKIAVGASYPPASFDRLKRPGFSTRGLFSLIDRCSRLENLHLIASANIHFRYTILPPLPVKIFI
jgi:hypothetical protein